MRRRVRRWLPRWSQWMLLGLLLLSLARFAGPRPAAESSLPPAGVPVDVRWALDGDTLLLASGQRVRLIGVDTPETKHPERPPQPWGEAAARFTQQRVDGRSVVLEYDRERIDIYRRVLAYVWIDGELLNATLIAEGYSPAVMSFPYRSDRQREFRKAEHAARAAQRGIWSSSLADGLRAAVAITVAPE